MSRPVPLPEALQARPFTVAEALAAGVPADVLDGARFRRPHRGVRVPVDLPDTLAVRCAAAQLVLPVRSCFAGRTGLELCRVQLPALPPGAAPVLCVAVPPGPVPELAGVAARQSRFSDRQLTVGAEGLGGIRLRVLHPVHAWCDVASTSSLHDAVALGDGVRRRWSTDELMRAVVDSRGRSRGVVRLREAVALVRYPVDSWWESVVRLLLVEAGVPEPDVNQDVSAAGGWLSRPDLSWPGVEVAIEYDGDHHRTSKRQWRHDQARRRVMRQHGWIVLELTADDVLVTPGRTVRQVEEALRERGMTW